MLQQLMFGVSVMMDSQWSTLSVSTLRIAARLPTAAVQNMRLVPTSVNTPMLYYRIGVCSTTIDLKNSALGMLRGK